MEIPKYRAWDKLDKKMRDVFSIDWQAQDVLLAPDILRSFSEIVLLGPTGLKDKKGKEGGMREIKFRAWDKVGMVMTEPFFLGSELSMLLGQDVSETENTVIMQYIDRKDKNDVEIYEGNVVRDSNGVVSTIVWESSEAKFCASDSDISLYYAGEAFEVIGNIYENPELVPKG